MNKLLICFFLVAVCLEGCVQKGKNKHIKSNARVEKTLLFDIDKSVPFEEYDSFFQKDKIIKLETNIESLIGSVYKIEYRNNRVYIIDRFKEPSVSCFNSNGKFKFKLKSIGKGPMEYIQILDGCINSYSGDIELLVNFGQELMVYDSSGVFNKRIKLPYAATSFCCLKNIRYFYKGYSGVSLTEKTSFRLYSMDYSGTNIRKYLWFSGADAYTGSVSVTNFSRAANNEYRFIESYNDTIYKITNETFKPLYEIYFKRYNEKVPEYFLSDCEEYPDKEETALKLKLPSIDSYTEFDNYIIGNYSIIYKKNSSSSSRIIHNFIFDKISNKLIANAEGVKSESLNMVANNFMPSFLFADAPCDYIYPYEIESCIGREMNTLALKQRNSKICSYFEYDNKISNNPILLKYKSIHSNEIKGNN